MKRNIVLGIILVFIVQFSSSTEQQEINTSWEEFEEAFYEWLWAESLDAVRNKETGNIGGRHALLLKRVDWVTARMKEYEAMLLEIRRSGSYPRAQSLDAARDEEISNTDTIIERIFKRHDWIGAYLIAKQLPFFRWISDEVKMERRAWAAEYSVEVGTENDDTGRDES